jgi:hypothetical protein
VNMAATCPGLRGGRRSPSPSISRYTCTGAEMLLQAHMLSPVQQLLLLPSVLLSVPGTLDGRACGPYLLGTAAQG